MEKTYHFTLVIQHAEFGFFRKKTIHSFKVPVGSYESYSASRTKRLHLEGLLREICQQIRSDNPKIRGAYAMKSEHVVTAINEFFWWEDLARRQEIVSNFKEFDVNLRENYGLLKGYYILYLC